MTTKLIELRTNRALLNPDFDGYKLSLQEIPVLKKEIDNGVDRILPDSSQYSLLHAKLFGLHNHLIGETLNGIDAVYFVDKNHCVQKTYIDTFSNNLNDLIQVWQIPVYDSIEAGDYNISIKFASENLAVATDGKGMLFILNTGCRSNDDLWNVLFSELILANSAKFVIQDVVYKEINNRRELHVLLLSIVQDEITGRFSVVLNYVTLTEASDKTWGAVALRELRGKGDVHYCYFEPQCKAIYIASDNEFKFTIDSENPVIENKETDNKHKTYIWTQTKDDVTLKFPLAEDFIKNNIKVDTKSDEICVMYMDNVLLSGKLCSAIDSDLTTWTAENKMLEVVLSKIEVGLMWPEVVKGDQNGEFILETCIVEDVHKKLQHLCSDIEATPPAGVTFNSQQVEECDFENDKTLIFKRINIETHEATHSANIGSNHILLTVNLIEHLPPAIALRNDVDACLWQPVENETDFMLKHEGTLLAFSYVQASKQQRKFSTCSPDLGYSVICETNRHVFIYRQQKVVTSGELRNRNTGRRVANVAQQQVVNITSDEILGIYATNQMLFILTTDCLYALNIR